VAADRRDVAENLRAIMPRHLKRCGA
jgi:hypothetical protein